MFNVHNAITIGYTDPHNYPTKSNSNSYTNPTNTNSGASSIYFIAS